jgi:two-component system alkaline phosphatase synthesis response regulator PhoP
VISCEERSFKLSTDRARDRVQTYSMAIGVDETRVRSILIVEDDEDIADSIRYNLEREGFRIRVATMGEDALDLILKGPPNLILLDLNLPHMSGFEICRRLRAETPTAQIPIIMLTARADEVDKVLGLNMGADDYITKPFSMRELVARINAALRRTEGAEIERAAFDNGVLRIDPSTFRVSYQDREVRMTRKEFALLSELARHQGRVLTREALLDRVWGMNYFGDTRTLDVHIRRLRKKLGDPAVIETVTGVGYRLVSSERQRI